MGDAFFFFFFPLRTVWRVRVPPQVGFCLVHCEREDLND